MNSTEQNISYDRTVRNLVVCSLLKDNTHKTACCMLTDYKNTRQYTSTPIRTKAVGHVMQNGEVVVELSSSLQNFKVMSLNN